MAKAKRTLPDFQNPPVVEVVLGVQFPPIERFLLAHYGLFWGKVRRDFPEFIPKPPIPAVIEGFEPPSPKEPTINVEVTQEPEIRAWLVDRTQTQLLQIQKDRFLYNWKKSIGTEIYPHYENIEPRFKSEWERFCDFLTQENLAIPDINQCEVTYVNHLEIGKGWKSFGELNKVIAVWSGETSEVFLPEPERVMLKTQFLIEQKRGRLHVSLQPGIRRSDAKELLKLELTARGRPESSRLEHILEWFELGHQWIVQGFTAFTAGEMHQSWGRVQ